MIGPLTTRVAFSTVILLLMVTTWLAPCPATTRRLTTGGLHVTNAGACSRYEFAKAILQSAGLAKVPVKPVKTSPAPGVAIRPVFAPLDNARFEDKTGAPLRSWNEALAEYMISAGGPLA